MNIPPSDGFVLLGKKKKEAADLYVRATWSCLFFFFLKPQELDETQDLIEKLKIIRAVLEQGGHFSGERGLTFCSCLSLTFFSF